MDTDKKSDDQIADEGKKPATSKKPADVVEEVTKEVGGRDGPDPTRYGDWENKGILSDF